MNQDLDIRLIDAHAPQRLQWAKDLVLMYGQLPFRFWSLQIFPFTFSASIFRLSFSAMLQHYNPRPIQLSVNQGLLWTSGCSKVCLACQQRKKEIRHGKGMYIYTNLRFTPVLLILSFQTCLSLKVLKVLNCISRWHPWPCPSRSFRKCQMRETCDSPSVCGRKLPLFECCQDAPDISQPRGR